MAESDDTKGDLASRVTRALHFREFARLTGDISLLQKEIWASEKAAIIFGGATYAWLASQKLESKAVPSQLWWLPFALVGAYALRAAGLGLHMFCMGDYLRTEIEARYLRNGMGWQSQIERNPKWKKAHVISVYFFWIPMLVFTLGLALLAKWHGW